MEEYRKYFKNNEGRLAELEKLHQKKYELKELLDNAKEKNIQLDPYIVELSGLPRTGKSVAVDKLNEFFKMADFKVVRTTEPAEILKNRYTRSEISKLSNVEFNDQTLLISREEINNEKNKEPDIILQDRGVIDNYFWYQMMYMDGVITPEYYETKLLEMASDLLDMDHLFLMTAKPEIIVFRDYMNQIFLEQRKKTTIERVTQLNEGIEKLLPIIYSSISKNKITRLDTSDITEIDTTMIIADKIIDEMHSKVLRKSNNN